MLDKDKSEAILEDFYRDNLNYWRREGNDEFEAHKSALENDMIGLFKQNNGCLHDPNVPRGEELDIPTTIAFLKARCIDLYGKKWENHWKEYGLE